MRNHQRGLGIIEVLLSLALVGMVLGLVAKGYQTVSRLNQVSYQLSQKLEAAAFLRRLGSELSSATTVSSITNGVELTKINFSLNTERSESFDRLPWPRPYPATSVNLNSGMVTVRYALNSDGEIIRTYEGTSNLAVSEIGTFQATVAGQTATIELTPTRPGLGWKSKVYLPGVTP